MCLLLLLLPLLLSLSCRVRDGERLAASARLPTPACREEMESGASSSHEARAPAPATLGDAKRRRLANLVGLKNVTSEALAAITRTVHAQGSEEFSTWQINHFIKTEFAKVRFDIDLPIGEADPFTWTVCRADLLVQYFAAEASPFRSVMDRAIRKAGGEPLRGILYLDEVTPGNVLRPDNQRKFWAVYLGFAECAAQHLCREEFWLPLAMLRTTIAGKVLGGMSYCIKALLRSLLFEPCKLAGVGMSVVLESPVLLRAALSNVLADEAALKAVWCSKGASGLRPCMLCRNVTSLNSDLLAGQTYLVDVSCSDSSQFALCTDEDVWGAFDRLCAPCFRLCCFLRAALFPWLLPLLLPSCALPCPWSCLRCFFSLLLPALLPPPCFCLWCSLPAPSCWGSPRSCLRCFLLPPLSVPSRSLGRDLPPPLVPPPAASSSRRAIQQAGARGRPPATRCLREAGEGLGPQLCEGVGAG